VPATAPEIRRYARNLFRLAREAGARGLPEEARRLLRLAAEIDNARGGEYRLYWWLARAVGWRRLAAWAEPRAARRRV
jgi:hypothetical protein